MSIQLYQELDAAATAHIHQQAIDRRTHELELHRTQEEARSALLSSLTALLGAEIIENLSILHLTEDNLPAIKLTEDESGAWVRIIQANPEHDHPNRWHVYSPDGRDSSTNQALRKYVMVRLGIQRRLYIEREENAARIAAQEAEIAYIRLQKLNQKRTLSNKLARVLTKHMRDCRAELPTKALTRPVVFYKWTWCTSPATNDIDAEYTWSWSLTDELDEHGYFDILPTCQIHTFHATVVCTDDEPWVRATIRKSAPGRVRKVRLNPQIHKPVIERCEAQTLAELPPQLRSTARYIFEGIIGRDHPAFLGEEGVEFQYSIEAAHHPATSQVHDAFWPDWVSGA